MTTAPARRRERYDAIVIGAGPNGLAAALTLPGFTHDVCSAIHPYAVASPFFQRLPLERYGVEWIHSPAPLAHPLPDGRVATLERSLDDLERTLGAHDAAAWRRLVAPYVSHWDEVV